MIRVYEDLNLGIYFGTLRLFLGILGLFWDFGTFSVSDFGILGLRDFFWGILGLLWGFWDFGTFIGILGIFFQIFLVFSVSDFVIFFRIL